MPKCIALHWPRFGGTEWFVRRQRVFPLEMPETWYFDNIQKTSSPMLHFYNTRRSSQKAPVNNSKVCQISFSKIKTEEFSPEKSQSLSTAVGCPAINLCWNCLCLDIIHANVPEVAANASSTILFHKRLDWDRVLWCWANVGQRLFASLTHFAIFAAPQIGH